MRIPSNLWLLFIEVASAASQSVQILLRNGPSISPISTSDKTVKPETAKLILAQRLGFSNSYSLSGSDEDMIQQINVLGGPQEHPFSINQERSGSPILLVIEGVDNADSLVSPQEDLFARLEVKPTPSLEATHEMVDEFVQELKRYSSNPSLHNNVILPEAKLFPEEGTTIIADSQRIIIRVTSLLDAAKRYGMQSSEYQSQLEIITSALKNLPSTPMFSSIIIPYNVKPTTTSSWGSKIQRRNENLLAAASSEKPVVKISPNLNSVSSPGLGSKAIPSRYSSQDSCERETRNCTGHGHCRLIFNETTGDRKLEQYGCICDIPSVRDNHDGSKKTTYYGGSACQKIDISAPFWLLAGTTIFLVTVLSFGIGMLYSIGGDELPSVIGAGVTGPRAK